MTFEDFARGTKTVRATAYEVGIIGEATAKLPLAVREAYPEVPWEKMQAMRNFVFHEYFRVDLDNPLANDYAKPSTTHALATCDFG
jgi:uncharacterized protein with HEPN domain